MPREANLGRLAWDGSRIITAFVGLHRVRYLHLNPSKNRTDCGPIRAWSCKTCVQGVWASQMRPPQWTSAHGSQSPGLATLNGKACYRKNVEPTMDFAVYGDDCTHREKYSKVVERIGRLWYSWPPRSFGRTRSWYSWPPTSFGRTNPADKTSGPGTSSYSTITHLINFIH